LLYVISCLKGEGVANLSVSSAARSPLYQFRLPISHCSLPSALLQKWSGLDSACLAVEALHVEGPLDLQLKNLTPIAVDAAAIAFLKPILSKPANSWTLAARTLQLLCRPLVRPFLPLEARWTDPVSIPMFRYFSWRKRQPIVKSSVAKGSTRTRVQNLSKQCQGWLQNRPPTFPNLRKRQHPRGSMSTWVPTLLQRKLENLDGTRWSKRSQTSSWPSAQHHPLQKHSGFASAFSLC
jgi:hypothetical protein